MSLFSSSLPVAAISISSRNHSQLSHISPTYHQLKFEFERLFSNLNKATLKRVSGSLSSSILLVAGTTWMIVIVNLVGGCWDPSDSQESGFLASAVACILCWIFMIVTGLLIAEVNVNTMCELGSGGVSLVSMAKKTLGTVGIQIAWTAIVLGTAIPLGLFLVSK